MRRKGDRCNKTSIWCTMWSDLATTALDRCFSTTGSGRGVPDPTVGSGREAPDPHLPRIIHKADGSGVRNPVSATPLAGRNVMAKYD
ncbi:Uncharacterized protein TCM_035524 [Theobroma cacao]|uniref:Uncharacterized protein n=1 Tax=Theobroma cacao TaxID=3641 RepID=A0A061FJ75_THECC|nr:Uncharacterized protein TCM_035524 [Theobroma cacao]